MKEGDKTTRARTAALAQLDNREALHLALSGRDLEAVRAALTGCAQAAALEGAELHTSAGFGGGSVGSDRIAAWLLRQLDESSPEEALTELAVGLVHKRQAIVCNGLVYGVRAEQPLDVGGGYVLRPAIAAEIRGRIEPNPTDWTSLFKHDTILARKWPTKLVQAPPEREDWNRERVQELMEAEEILGLLSLVTGSGAFRHIRWSFSDGPLLALGANTIGEGVSHAAVGFLPPTVTVAQAVETAALYNKLVKLGKARDALNFSMRSYRRAAGSRDSPQTVVSITVAIEGLLMQGEKDALTQSIALRGAWLLDGGEDERLRTYEFLVSLYGKRSDLVHSGGKSWGWEVVPDRPPFIDEAIALYRQLATKMICDGVQEWKRLILGLKSSRPVEESDDA